MTDKLTDQLQSTDEIQSLRPRKLEDFIGQKSLKDNLKVFISAAKARKQSLDHTLLYGPPGLGKTTLSEIISYELGTNLRITAGPVITKPGDLASILTNLQENDVLFVDEIHRLNIATEEVLYSAMEDFKLDIILGEGPTANNIRIDIPRFTLVGATTRYGLLSSPLRDRFSIVMRLAFYSPSELEQVINRSAELLSIKITKKGAHIIAKSARGTPRIANNLLKRISDFLVMSNKLAIDEELALNALSRLGIDEYGLDEIDYKYLFTIAEAYKGGPVSLETLAAVLSENKGTVEDVIEPYLLKHGFVNKTARGRCITEKTWQYLNLTSSFRE